MRALIQRVQHADVVIDGRTNGEIGQGLLILLGVHNTDTQEDIEWLAKKVTQLRIFDDENGVMNRSVMDINGEILVVSQFTLYASTKKGNRPSYINAAAPNFAVPIYEKFVTMLSATLGKPIPTGIFGADMKVSLLNDGPVTIMIDTKNRE